MAAPTDVPSAASATSPSTIAYATMDHWDFRGSFAFHVARAREETMKRFVKGIRCASDLRESGRGPCGETMGYSHPSQMTLVIHTTRAAVHPAETWDRTRHIATGEVSTCLERASLSPSPTVRTSRAVSTASGTDYYRATSRYVKLFRSLACPSSARNGTTRVVPPMCGDCVRDLRCESKVSMLSMHHGSTVLGSGMIMESASGARGVRCKWWRTRG